MKNIIYILSVALLSSTAFAEVNTLKVVSQGSANFIRAEYSQENTVIIKSCETFSDGEEVCEVIGNQAGYSEAYLKIRSEQLEKQRSTEKIITGGVVLVGVAIGAYGGVKLAMGKPTGGDLGYLADYFFGAIGAAIGGGLGGTALGLIYVAFANAEELSVALSKVNQNIQGENVEIRIEVNDMKSFKRDLMDALI